MEEFTITAVRTVGITASLDSVLGWEGEAEIAGICRLPIYIYGCVVVRLILEQIEGGLCPKMNETLSIKHKIVSPVSKYSCLRKFLLISTC